jgi:hypothetical protein
VRDIVFGRASKEENSKFVDALKNL